MVSDLLITELNHFQVQNDDDDDDDYYYHFELENDVMMTPARRSILSLIFTCLCITKTLLIMTSVMTPIAHLIFSRLQGSSFS